MNVWVNVNGKRAPEAKVERIVQKLGRGRYSVVFAVETLGGGSRAVKVLALDGTREEEHAAQHEITVLARLNRCIDVCPGIPRLHAWGHFGDCYLFQTDIAGCDYKAWLKSGPHRPEQYKSALYQILGSLAMLQEKFGLVHYDLHWGNVLVDEALDECYHYSFWQRQECLGIFEVPTYGKRFTLCDFGLSEMHGRAPHTRATKKLMFRDVDQIVGGTLEWPIHGARAPLHGRLIRRALSVGRKSIEKGLRDWLPPALVFMKAWGQFKGGAIGGGKKKAYICDVRVAFDEIR